MSYYRKPPVLDEKEQAEFDKYLKEQYAHDLELATEIQDLYYKRNNFVTMGPRTQASSPISLAVFDKLATPRIYLLQAWLHKRSQEQAGVEEK